MKPATLSAPRSHEGTKFFQPFTLELAGKYDSDRATEAYARSGRWRNMSPQQMKQHIGLQEKLHQTLAAEVFSQEGAAHFKLPALGSRGQPPQLCSRDFSGSPHRIPLNLA